MASRSRAKPGKYAADDDEILDGPDVEETTIEAPDGTLLTVRYRGVDPSIPSGSAEYKKAKRLADNRASAARSRALHRVKVGDMESELEALRAAKAALEFENKRLRLELQQATGSSRPGTSSSAASVVGGSSHRTAPAHNHHHGHSSTSSTSASTRGMTSVSDRNYRHHNEEDDDDDRSGDNDNDAADGDNEDDASSSTDAEALQANNSSSSSHAHRGAASSSRKNSVVPGGGSGGGVLRPRGGLVPPHPVRGAPQLQHLAGSFDSTVTASTTMSAFSSSTSTSISTFSYGKKRKRGDLTRGFDSPVSDDTAMAIASAATASIDGVSSGFGSVARGFNGNSNNQGNGVREVEAAAVQARPLPGLERESSSASSYMPVVEHFSNSNNNSNNLGAGRATLPLQATKTSVARAESFFSVLGNANGSVGVGGSEVSESGLVASVLAEMAAATSTSNNSSAAGDNDTDCVDMTGPTATTTTTATGIAAGASSSNTVHRRLGVTVAPMAVVQDRNPFIKLPFGSVVGPAAGLLSNSGINSNSSSGFAPTNVPVLATFHRHRKMSTGMELLGNQDYNSDMDSSDSELQSVVSSYTSVSGNANSNSGHGSSNNGGSLSSNSSVINRSLTSSTTSSGVMMMGGTDSVFPNDASQSNNRVGNNNSNNNSNNKYSSVDAAASDNISRNTAQQSGGFGSLQEVPLAATSAPRRIPRLTSASSSGPTFGGMSWPSTVMLGMAFCVALLTTGAAPGGTAGGGGYTVRPRAGGSSTTDGTTGASSTSSSTGGSSSAGSSSTTGGAGSKSASSSSSSSSSSASAGSASSSSSSSSSSSGGDATSATGGGSIFGGSLGAGGRSLLFDASGGAPSLSSGLFDQAEDFHFDSAAFFDLGGADASAGDGSSSGASDFGGTRADSSNSFGSGTNFRFDTSAMASAAAAAATLLGGQGAMDVDFTSTFGNSVTFDSSIFSSSSTAAAGHGGVGIAGSGNIIPATTGSSGGILSPALQQYISAPGSIPGASTSTPTFGSCANPASSASGTSTAGSHMSIDMSLVGPYAVGFPDPSAGMALGPVSPTGFSTAVDFPSFAQLPQAAGTGSASNGGLPPVLTPFAASSSTALEAFRMGDANSHTYSMPHGTTATGGRTTSSSTAGSCPSLALPAGTSSSSSASAHSSMATGGAVISNNFLLPAPPLKAASSSSGRGAASTAGSTSARVGGQQPSSVTIVIDTASPLSSGRTTTTGSTSGASSSGAAGGASGSGSSHSGSSHQHSNAGGSGSTGSGGGSSNSNSGSSGSSSGRAGGGSGGNEGIDMSAFGASMQAGLVTDLNGLTGPRGTGNGRGKGKGKGKGKRSKNGKGGKGGASTTGSARADERLSTVQEEEGEDDDDEEGHAGSASGDDVDFDDFDRFEDARSVASYQSHDSPRPTKRARHADDDITSSIGVDDDDQHHISSSGMTMGLYLGPLPSTTTSNDNSSVASFSSSFSFNTKHNMIDGSDTVPSSSAASVSGDSYVSGRSKSSDDRKSSAVDAELDRLVSGLSLGQTTTTTGSRQHEHQHQHQQQQQQQQNPAPSFTPTALASLATKLSPLVPSLLRSAFAWGAPASADASRSLIAGNPAALAVAGAQQSMPSYLHDFLSQQQKHLTPSAGVDGTVAPNTGSSASSFAELGANIAGALGSMLMQQQQQGL